MDNFIIYSIVFVLLALGVYFGAFKNDYYSNKYAQKKATEVKVILQNIRKAELLNSIHKLLEYRTLLQYNYSTLHDFKENNPNAYEQVISIATQRYQQIHKSPLDLTQRDFISLNSSFKDLYSRLLISVLSNQIGKLENEILSLKTKEAKNKRISFIKTLLSIACDELKTNGNTLYIEDIEKLPSVELSEEIIIEKKQVQTGLNFNVKDLCLDVLVDKYNIDKDVASKLIYNSSIDSSKHIPEKMIMTERIMSLKCNISGKGRPNNDFIRDGYETVMPSIDFTSFFKECINNNDIESIYQYLCLLKGWGYDSEASQISGFSSSFVTDRLEKYYKNTYLIYEILAKPNNLYQYNELLHNIEKEFKGITVEYVLGILLPQYMNDKERVKKIAGLDFTKHLVISQECKNEILTVFFYLLPYFDFNRGYFNSLGEDCLAERVSFALTIYDFNVINMELMANIANLIIDTEAKNNDYYKEMPKFIGIKDTEYKTPISDSLKDKLSSYGIAERYFLLHDLYMCGSTEPYYKTKSMGINENDTLKRFIEDGFIIKNTDRACLMTLTKDELINIANEQNITVRKSWTKSKIFTCITENESCSDVINKKINDLNIMQINPIYENDFKQLIDYQKEINQVVKLLFFI